MNPAQYPAARQTLLRGPNGIQTLRIPLEKKRPGQIADIEKWQRETLQAIRTAYGTAPFYPYYDYLIAEVLESTQSFDHLCIAADAFCRRVLNLEPANPAAGFTGIGPALPVLAYDYGQRFTEHYPFTERISILDVIFNAGPLSCDVIAGKPL
ncbi:MAG: WbqC family protein [Bacteroidia bacterium]